MNSKCAHCDEEILPHEIIADFEGKVHRECSIRMTVGSLGHQLRRCHCFGGSGNGDFANLTARQNAIVAAWFFNANWQKAESAKFN